MRETVSNAWANPERPGLIDELEQLTNRAAGDADLLAQIRLCQARAHTWQTKDLGAATALADELLALDRESLHPTTWLRLLNLTGFLMLEQGRYAEAVEPLVAALRGGAQQADEIAVVSAGVNLAETLLVMGDAEGALRAIERTRPVSTSFVERDWAEVRACIDLERTDDARAVGLQALAEGVADTERRKDIRACIVAELARLDGRWDDVERALAPRLQREHTLTNSELVIANRLLAEAAFRTHRLDDAQLWCDRAYAVMPRSGNNQEISVMRLASQVARARGDHDASYRLLDEALELRAGMHRRLASTTILSFAERHLAEIEQRDLDLATVNESLRRSRDTAAKALELAEASHARLVAITDTLPMQIAHISSEGIVEFANATMVDEWAQRGRSIVGSPMGELLVDSYGTLRAGYESAMGGSPFISVEQVPHHDGSVRHIEVNWVPGPPADRGTYLVAMDVSARIEQGQLEQQLQRTQRLESLGVLASAIAHNFNNLLTGLTTNIEVVVDRIRDPFAAEALADALTAAQRAADLTRQLFAFTGLARIKTESVELNDLLRDTVELLHAGTDKRARLHIQCADLRLPVVGEAAQLAQVCLNLIVNASEALQGGHGDVWVRTGRCEHDGSDLHNAHPDPTLPAGTYCWFEVQDSGVGIEPEQLRRVFEPFFTTKETGRGLGLAACLGIVRGHKGRIVLDSEPGQGTTMRVLLPWVDMSDSLPPGQVEHVPGARGRVLVVDDNEHVSRALKRILETEGWEVHLAPDGREGLRMFREVAPDLVFLDLTMPVMDGAQTLHALRSVSDVPVVLISGYTQSDASSLLGDGGAQGFLQKPLSVRTVLDVAARTAATRVPDAPR